MADDAMHLNQRYSKKVMFEHAFEIANGRCFSNFWMGDCSTISLLNSKKDRYYKGTIKRVCVWGWGGGGGWGVTRRKPKLSYGYVHFETT